MTTIKCLTIIPVGTDGVLFGTASGELYISFDECARNFAKEKGIALSKCVASRDITTFSYTFYSNQRTHIIFPKYSLKNIITGKTTKKMFSDLQNAIVKAGYTSYDLT